jgi:outer membrane lipoprotein SlyB
MTIRLLALTVLLLVLTACSSSSLEGAGKGALGGAAAGAVGGMISAAIFGGDVGNAAARGAAWGASVGAVSGAVQGSSADSAKKQRAASQEQARVSAEIAEIRRQLGEDAFTSLERLVDGKHEVALAYARTAQRSQNEDYALAGLWLEAIAYYDAGQERKAEALIPRLIEAEPTLNTEADTRVILVDLHDGLLEIREAFGITT